MNGNCKMGIKKKCVWGGGRQKIPEYAAQKEKKKQYKMCSENGKE